MRRTNVLDERLVGLFLLGLLLFSYPLLAAFNAPELVLGIPLLYLYLFVAWGALIAGAALVIRRSARAERPPR
jgi:hypothetical protein